MDNFLEQVESSLYSKSLRELQSFVMKLANKVPNLSQKEFLILLENRSLIIDSDCNSKSEPQKILERIENLLEGIGDFNIEAYYNDSWYGNEEYTVEDDDGFTYEFSYCYGAAERLLSEGQYEAAAKAFRMLFEVIDRFDECNSVLNYGDFYFEVFIENGMLQIDLNRAKALRGYSALMANESGSIMQDELKAIFEMCSTYNTYNNILMFKDVLSAGSIPVPNLENVLNQWVDFLYTQPPARASAFVKEAARLAGKPEIMERFAKTRAVGEPAACLDLCEILKEQGASNEKIAETAAEGLKRSPVYAGKREQLADLLVKTAEQTGDREIYTYAVLERFISQMYLENYLPIWALKSEESNQVALAALEAAKDEAVRNRRYDYYIIHLINHDYDTVFDAIKDDKSSLGWSGNLKGYLFAFFMGLVSGFDEKAVMIKKLVNESSEPLDGAEVYRILREACNSISAEQEEKWSEWCAREICMRVDAIVSGGHRGSYFKAAQLLIAGCEMQMYRKNAMAKENPYAILYDHWNKYPRHRAFRAEIHTALSESGMQIML